ncbi:MAG: CDP-diacylglycerol--serine O-phosphatidyltransferase [Proteobacteria bacterium]|nr:CDP-diacylglycerol--serine O-phosphatidyltransferase [Pseudomonadota bacterium]
MPTLRMKRKNKLRDRIQGIPIAPNLVTSASLFCGFYSIMLSINGQFQKSAWLIMGAVFFDMFDGLVARLTHSQSQFGKEYDSLSDLLSFGAAPSILMYLWAFQSLDRLGWAAAFLFTACAALRLARYNIHTVVTDTPKGDFTGLASTAAGATVAAIVLFFHEFGLSPADTYPYSFLLTQCGLALLMVSPLPYRSHKALNLAARRPFYIMLIAIAIFTLIILNPEMMFIIGFGSYALSGPCEWTWKKFHRQPAGEPGIETKGPESGPGKTGE